MKKLIHIFITIGFMGCLIGCSSQSSKKINATVKTKEEITAQVKLAKTQQDQLKIPLWMKFEYIKPGSFIMGSPSGESHRDKDEKQHRVTLTKGFYMQTTEVTQGQWKAVMGRNPSHFSNCGNGCPVENISWNDIQKFIRKLKQKGGKQYRLPTEAEWEYAARAGTATPFFFGDCLSTSQANYDGNYPLRGCPKGQPRKKTVAAACFQPNAWGLYDMHGNVWEWVQDRYGDYPSGNVTDPEGPSSGSGRVLRGGSWSSVARICRSANRRGRGPGSRGSHSGFRLVLLPGQQ
jgi:sulfatase modifying factor 1